MVSACHFSVLCYNSCILESYRWNRKRIYFLKATVQRGRNCLLLNNNGRIITSESHRQNSLPIIFLEQNNVVFSSMPLGNGKWYPKSRFFLKVIQESEWSTTYHKNSKFFCMMMVNNWIISAAKVTIYIAMYRYS